MEQPNRCRLRTYTYGMPMSATRQESPSWVYKAEWNGTLSDKLYVEARYGDFGYYYSADRQRVTLLVPRYRTRLSSPGRSGDGTRSRSQAARLGAATIFLDTGMGSHTLKFGGEMLRSSSVEGFQQRFRRQHRTSTQRRVQPGDLWLPTA